MLAHVVVAANECCLFFSTEILAFSLITLVDVSHSSIIKRVCFFFFLLNSLRSNLVVLTFFVSHLAHGYYLGSMVIDFAHKLLQSVT